MSERRSLIEGLQATPAALPANKEREFVYSEPSGAGEGHPAPTRPIARSPLTTRIREDYLRALKRVSLERQIAGTTPSTLQDLLEQAIEAWLRKHGELDDGSTPDRPSLTEKRRGEP